MGTEKGTYALLLCLDRETNISVGRLGLFSFPAGYYLYFGSALGGLFPRLRRHLDRDKRPRWHIDYLRRYSQVIEVWYVLSGEHLECAWCQIAAAMPQAQSVIPGFGSSDCRCRSHLLYFPSPPTFEVFRARASAKKEATVAATSPSYPIQKWSAPEITRHFLGSGSSSARR